MFRDRRRRFHRSPIHNIACYFLPLSYRRLSSFTTQDLRAAVDASLNVPPVHSSAESPVFSPTAAVGSPLCNPYTPQKANIHCVCICILTRPNVRQVRGRRPARSSWLHGACKTVRRLRFWKRQSDGAIRAKWMWGRLGHAYAGAGCAGGSRTIAICIV